MHDPPAIGCARDAPVIHGSNDTTQLGKPAETAIEREADEIYVADGYGNHRLIVFDASTGAYKRHWGLWQSAE